MSKILTIDIGNTNITLGVFQGRSLIKKTKIPTPEYSMYPKLLKQFLNKIEIKNTVISSVVPLALTRALAGLHKILTHRALIAGRDIAVPIKNLYKNKKEVGQDRLVNAFAAKVLYGAPAVVIDLGTAITFDVVSRKGEYLGGLIMPGIGLSLKSLYDRTALLPKVELKHAPDIIGKDTVASMRGGILFGFGAACDGLSAKYKKILGSDTRIIATGGNVKLMKRYAKSIRIIDEDLTLKGLSLLAKKNP